MWWWFGKYVSHLPYTRGPLVPGICDVMTGYSKNGLLMRFYYPTDRKPNVRSFAEEWQPWVADDCYVLGFARVIMLFAFLIRIASWLVSGFIRIPAVYGAKVKSSNEKIRVIIMSHGLGGTRFLYSSICIELASRGYLVVAVEHRDGSAATTYYYDSKEDACADRKTIIEHARVQLDGDHFLVRNGQVRERAVECKKVFRLLEEINMGEVPYNIMEDVVKEKTEFDLRDLVGKMDLEDATIMGHSFGAATAMVTLTSEKNLRRGILLDPWMFPVKDMPQLKDEIKQPLLFVNTQTFHIASNVKAMKALIDADPENRPMYTILHTTHESQSDTVFVVGYWLNWFMKKLPPKTATRLNNALIVRYLNSLTGYPEDFDCRNFLKENGELVSEGLTKAWA